MMPTRMVRLLDGDQTWTKKVRSSSCWMDCTWAPDVEATRRNGVVSTGTVVARTGESVYLSVAAGPDTAVYLAIEEGTHSVRHTNWVGRTVPLTGTAVGEALRGHVAAGASVLRTDTVESDVTALSSPVVVHGTPVGALSTLVPTYRCTDELAARCGEALVAATAEIARRLGEG